MEGPVSVVECVNARHKCDRNSSCGARTIWQQLNENIRNMMQNITLAEILQAYQDPDKDSDLEDYCI